MEHIDIQKMIEEALQPLRMAIEAQSAELEQAVKRIEEQEQTIELLRKTIDETLDQKMRSMSRRISEITGYADHN